RAPVFPGARLFPYTTLFRSIGEFASQLPIGLTRLCHAGWVVMGENHRGGILRQGPFDYLTRIYAGTVDSASVYPRQVVKRALARSEEHTSELQSRENLVCRL